MPTDHHLPRTCSEQTPAETADMAASKFTSYLPPLLSQWMSRPPYLLHIRSSTAFIIGAVCLAIFTDILLYGLIVPVIPFAISVRAGVAPDSVQQWNAILLSCYSLALFLGAPAAGLCADRVRSRRWPLLLGLVALAGSTLMLCLGRSVGVLAVARILQGLSAGVVWSVGLALLADTVGPSEVGVAMGWVSIAMSVGLLVSPVIGGAVYEAAGYYEVYYVAFSLIALDILLRILLVEKREAARWMSVEGSTAATAPGGNGAEADLESGAAAAAAAAAVEPPAEKGPDAGPSQEGTHGDSNTTANTAAPSDPPAAASIADPPGTATPTPTKPLPRHPHLYLIKSRRLLAALYGCVIQAVLWVAFDTVIPLFVKATFAWDSTAAGLIFFALYVAGFASPLVGILSDRHGTRWLSAGAFAAGVPVMVCLRFVSENTLRHKILLGALLFLEGTVLTITATPLMAEITYAIESKAKRRPGIWGDKGVYGIGYGLFTNAFALGGTVGSLVAGYVVAGAGWGTLTWVLAVFSASGAVVVALWCGEQGRDGGRKDEIMAERERSAEADPARQREPVTAGSPEKGTET